MLDQLAQMGNFPWEKILGGASAAVLASIVYLFVKDIIRTTASAQKEIDGWKEIAAKADARADKCEERMIAALQLARAATEAAEKTVSKSKGD